MLYTLEILSTGLLAYILSVFFIPAFKQLAYKINLVDQPNHRKIHQAPVPLIGGISIALSVALSLLISPDIFSALSKYSTFIATSALLLITGVLDDKYDIKAKYKLFIQLVCAFSIALAGTRITSLCGVFGIHDLPLYIQYLLTMLVITGVVNAFNLMDGIDGLAGGLSLVGFMIMAILSFVFSDYTAAIMYTAFIGALVGFLKFNLTTKKIFMGDAGSLLLGFVLVVSGIQLLEQSQHQLKMNQSPVLFLIVGFFCIPVLDSLRVYLVRIKKGSSPFKADRSHLHHLFLLTGLSHKKISLLINSLVVFLLIVSGLMCYYFSVTFILAVIILGFYLVTKILSLNKDLNEWKTRIRKIEND